ncbi:MAG: MFS transporter [Gammaproteobacteria bacterium]|nr:MFS transporter [Gammaproteobacteria bacterium]
MSEKYSLKSSQLPEQSIPPKLINSLNEKSIWVMLFLGFSAGLPYLLVFGTLGTWLNEAGVEKSAITYFSWAGLGYGFKFIWAPLIDQARLPILTNLFGRRRSWLLLCQALLLVILAGMALTNPAASSHNLTIMALLAVALGFTAASQDIVIDAYRIEITPPQFLGLSSSSYILGYRIGMIIASTFALIISEKLGSELNNYDYSAWRSTYFIMAAFMFIGIITTLIIKEPQHTEKVLDARGSKQLILLFLTLIIPFILVYTYWKLVLGSVISFPENMGDLSPLSSFLYTSSRFLIALVTCFACAYFLTKGKIISTHVAVSAYLNPVQEFIKRYPLKVIVLILLLIGFYRVSDMVLGVVANLFYQDIGYSKEQIGYISKFFGLTITILGSFFGGFLITRYGTMKILLVGAILSAVTNLLFMGLADMSEIYNIKTTDTNLMLAALTLVICADNLAGGIANIAFIAFLSRLSNIEFTAMQYAIFSSLMALLPRLIGGYSGSIVESTDYQTFFLITTLMGVPVIMLVMAVAKRLTLKEDNA